MMVQYGLFPNPIKRGHSEELSKGATYREDSDAALYEVAPLASIRCQLGLFSRNWRFFPNLVV